VRREKPIPIILAVIAIVFVVIGIMYITILPRNLPSFFPGHVDKKAAVVHKKNKNKTTTSVSGAGGATGTTHPGATGATGSTTKPKKAKAAAVKKSGTKYYWKRGVASFFVAGVLLIIAWSLSETRKRMQKKPRAEPSTT
jgi:hypothetical protein